MLNTTPDLSAKVQENLHTLKVALQAGFVQGSDKVKAAAVHFVLSALQQGQQLLSPALPGGFVHRVGHIRCKQIIPGSALLLLL